ncbi:hypothetical protein HN587_07115 [Candidatus Woesearchaeota archaeon]|jgi:hypothetical protein|nr:hypothetical protein [Candidatus Woesearchaeota archaeon]
MPPHHLFNPLHFGIDLVYTLIIVFLCLLVYFKTKEMYVLTKHRGIEYFRNSFLLFGAAYLTRFIFHGIQLSIITLDLFIRPRFFGPIVLTLTAFFSTLAIFYLVYSTNWKKFKYNSFLIVAYSVSVLVAVISLFTHAPMIIALVQLPLLLFVIVANISDTKKKNYSAKAIYVLISLFWLINLFVLSPKRILPFDITLLFQIFSLVVFIVLIHKLFKWIR